MEPYTRLVKHPVIALFIAQKWKKTKGYFYTQSFVFLSFLLSYSSFILNLFTRPEVYCSELEKLIFRGNSTVIKESFFFSEGDSERKRERNCEKQTIRMTKKFMTEFDDNFLVCELCLLLFFSFLFSMEIYQAVKLRRQYFKELENFIEWVVLISALLTMMFMDIIHQNTGEAAVLRGIAALGIFVLGWN